MVSILAKADYSRKALKKQKSRYEFSLTKKKFSKIHQRNKYLPEQGSSFHIHHFSIHKLYKNPPIISFLNYGKDHFFTIRNDSSIELWDSNTMIRRIPGRPASQIRKGLFIYGRLVTVGLDGFIRLWSIPDLKIISQVPSNGGAIWDCCKISQNEFAIACDDGKARIFKCHIPDLSSSTSDARATGFLGSSDAVDILDPIESSAQDPDAYINISVGEDSSMNAWDIEVVKTFTPGLMGEVPHKYHNEGNVNRLLTIAYDHQNNYLICGGTTGLSCFSIQTREMKFHIKPTGIVWCICKTGKGEFAFGDSEGNVSFFETFYGTILQEFTKHAHVVTSLHLFQANSNSYLASVGVDGQLVIYSKKTSSHWSFSVSKRPSISDLYIVTTLNAKPGLLVMGGVDAQIIDYKIDQLSVMKRGAFVTTRIDLVGENNFTSSDGLGIYAFHDGQKNIYIVYAPISSENQVSESSYFIRSFEYRPTVVLHLKMESRAGWNISSITMSPDAKYLAVSTLDGIELLELSHSRGSFRCEVVTRTNLRNLGMMPAQSLRFATNNILVSATRTQQIELFSIIYMKKLSITLDNGHSRLLSYFTNHQNKINGRLGTKAFNSCIQYIAANNRYLVVGYGHIISVYSMQNILDTLTKQRLERDQTEKLSSIDPLFVLPFIHATILTLNISQKTLYVLGTSNTFSTFNLENGTCPIKQGFVQFNFEATKVDSNSPVLEHLPNERFVGNIKFVHELSKGNLLVASHKEAFLYDAVKQRISSILLDEEGLVTSILALQPIGPRQLITCTVSNQLQVFELPSVIFRRRFGAM